jgi:hypothetical protein
MMTATQEFVDSVQGTIRILQANLEQVGTQTEVVFDHASRDAVVKQLVETLTALLKLPTI